MKNILIVDDEKDIRSALKIYLANDEYSFLECENGKEAIEILKSSNVALVILDIMMPILNGLETLATLREFSNVPVILLTAKSEDVDIIKGLNMGADDYIKKPFNPLEVIARVKSQLRRYVELGGSVKSENTLCVGGIILDDKQKEVAVDGEQVGLTPLEFDILKLLMSSEGTLFSPTEIYEKVWKDTSLGGENTVAVHVRHLREKIEIDPANPRYIKVVWGRGYKIDKK
ncbi:MAG: response regulator transcription factor [Bacillota bacterium]